MSIIKRKAGSEDIVKSVLEFDETPTEGSPNLVESGAVAQAIGNSGKTAVFECTYSQDAQGYVYPTYEELNAARVAGKLPVIVEISPVGGRIYYVATQMSAYQNNVKFYFVNSESGAMLKLEGPTSNPVWSTGSAYDDTLSSTRTNAVQNSTLFAVIGNVETLLAAL